MNDFSKLIDHNISSAANYQEACWYFTCAVHGILSAEVASDKIKLKHIKHYLSVLKAREDML